MAEILYFYSVRIPQLLYINLIIHTLVNAYLTSHIYCTSDFSKDVVAPRSSNEVMMTYMHT